MIRSPFRLVAALALVALMAFVAACGGSSNESSSSKEGGATKQSLQGGKKGGTLQQLGASDVDFLDPGQTYYTGGYQVLYATMTTLYLPKPGTDLSSLTGKRSCFLIVVVGVDRRKLALDFITL